MPGTQTKSAPPAPALLAPRTPAGPPRLRLGETIYTVHFLVDGRRVYAVRLTKTDGTCYDVAVDGSECDCPDRVYRPEKQTPCKHMTAVQDVILPRLLQ